jgi:hypothetical protein
MKPINSILFRLLLSIVFISMVSVVSAQDADTGLSGSLETNHQTYFYKDPNKAFLLAFFPGLLIHGYGHFYAQDNLTGNILLTGEVISVVSVGLGALIKSDPNTFSGGFLGSPTGAVDLGNDLIWGGVVFFTGLWIFDMAHAPTAAADYNDEHSLKPVAYLNAQNQPTVALAYRF